MATPDGDPMDPNDPATASSNPLMNDPSDLPDMDDPMFSDPTDPMGMDTDEEGLMNQPDDPMFDDPTMGDNMSPYDDNMQPSQDPQVDPDTGHNVYKFTTNVEQHTNLAKDVEEMMKKMQAQDRNGAEQIYRNGKNSIIYENGIEVGTRSLAGLSTAESLAMANNNIFNQYLHALGDEDGKFLGKDVRLYADTIVTDAIENNKALADLTLASEGAVLLNIWMYAINEMDRALDACKKKEIFDLTGEHPIDRVAALWIGDSEQGKTQPQADAGHTLYAMSEYQESKFEVDTNKANNDILELLVDMKSVLSTPSVCVSDELAYLDLRTLATKVVSKMKVPMIQGLIHYIRNTDEKRGILYANAFVPLTAKCNAGTYEYIKRKLLLNEKFSFSKIETDAVIEAIYSTLDCLGLTCADIGKYKFVDEFNCKDRSNSRPFAEEYIPDTDVHGVARLDIDINELSILMDQGAISAARDLYVYGRHAVISDSKTLSLHELATDSNRSKVPEYSVYSAYYKDNDYAENLVNSGFTTSKIPGATKDQRKEIVVKGSQYLVVHLGALTAMHEALSACNNGRITDAMANWDKVAALLIGSMGHTEHGVMMHALGKEQCQKFGTCRGGDARVNEELMPLLFSGKTEITDKSCSALSQSIDDIKSLINVPLVQSALAYAETNRKAKNGDGTLASGYVFSRAVLPLIEAGDPQAASVIDKNMDLEGSSNPEEVYSAFKNTYSLLNVDCAMIGKAEFDACTAEPTKSSSAGDHGGAVVGIMVAVIGAILLFFLFKFKKPSKKGGEQPVEFVIGDKEDNNLV